MLQPFSISQRNFNTWHIYIHKSYIYISHSLANLLQITVNRDDLRCLSLFCSTIDKSDQFVMCRCIGPVLHLSLICSINVYRFGARYGNRYYNTGNILQVRNITTNWVNGYAINTTAAIVLHDSTFDFLQTSARISYCTALCIVTIGFQNTYVLQSTNQWVSARGISNVVRKYMVWYIIVSIEYHK